MFIAFIYNLFIFLLKGYLSPFEMNLYTHCTCKLYSILTKHVSEKKPKCSHKSHSHVSVIYGVVIAVLINS